MRLFVALELDDSVRRALGAALETLARRVQGVKWVRPETIHITLKFLGEMKDSDLPRIAEAVAECAKAAAPSRLDFRGLGAFPNADRPRVVWAGASEPVNPGALARLSGNLDAALAPFGAKRENRAFKAHATLGRVRRPKSMPELARSLRQMAEEPFGQMEAAEIVLMQSDLTPKGPVYKPLSRHPLCG